MHLPFFLLYLNFFLFFKVGHVFLCGVDSQQLVSHKESWDKYYQMTSRGSNMCLLGSRLSENVQVPVVVDFLR